LQHVTRFAVLEREWAFLVTSDEQTLVWSVVCIFDELILRTPYLPGESDMDQLDTKFRALVTPVLDMHDSFYFLVDMLLS
jgi:hypothetical protein